MSIAVKRSFHFWWIRRKDVRPRPHAYNRQCKLERLRPSGSIGLPEHVVDWPHCSVTTASQAKTKAAFPWVVDVPVQDESVNTLGFLDALVRLG